MKDSNNLMYFLDSIKDTLTFENGKDFSKNIQKNKDFRIRIQKLVYLSKYFGWNNSYHFNFHENGPYSVELSKDYQTGVEFLNNFENNLDLDMDLFKKFIKNQSTESLEASSTILYYIDKTKLSNISKNNITEIISHLKPHIPKNIIENSFDKIKKFKLLNKKIKKHTELTDEIVLDKINGLKNIFANFEECCNTSLILGSLDYFKISIKKANIDEKLHSDLLKAVYDYCEDIEKCYFINYDLSEKFVYFDFSKLDLKFNSLQNYICYDLKIIPKLYDENVDLSIFL